jgi:hypothetical protein
MTRTNDPLTGPVQPALSELMARYLQRQASAVTAGLVAGEPEGEVLPFEAAPVQPVNPQLAWSEAVSAARYFCPGSEPRLWKAPPEWPTLVTAHEPASALAFCFGNFPQLVRNLQLLLQASDVATLRPRAGRPVPAPALLAWADQEARRNPYPQPLIAASVFRLARQFDRASELLKAQQGEVLKEWQAARANEEAALAWHRGQAAEAAALWQVQPESVPVLFNRGMAALFLDRPGEALTWLSRAVADLPEESGWHHLGRLYLTLAEMRD